LNLRHGIHFRHEYFFGLGSSPENKKADRGECSSGAVIKVGLLVNEFLGRAEISFA
jgi:hypothetical protein